jgi:hypothetical protein
MARTREGCNSDEVYQEGLDNYTVELYGAQATERDIRVELAKCAKP